MTNIPETFSPQPLKDSFALITGASQGLGKEFAIELAGKGINLILVSLPDQHLDQFCLEIQDHFHVIVHCYETDLSNIDNIQTMCDWVNTYFNVYLLVNNAGVGGSANFLEADVNYINAIIQVNVMATSIITHQLLPNLLQQAHGYILNISSLAAFTPVGFKTVYPASKSFINAFTKSLAEELKATSVSVSVVNPGAMNTSEEIKQRIRKLGCYGQLTILDPKKVAKYCIQQLLRKEKLIVVNPVSLILLALLPLKWTSILLTHVVRKELLP